MLLLSLTLFGLICSEHIRTSLIYLSETFSVFIKGYYYPIRIGNTYYNYIYPVLSTLFLKFFKVNSNHMQKPRNMVEHGRYLYKTKAEKSKKKRKIPFL